MENKIKQNILFVEDDKEILSAIQSTLERFSHFNLISAYNGEDGLEKYLKYKDIIDVIITDIAMPIKNGLDMISDIRNIDRNIPIIVVTAHQEKSYLIELIEKSISHFILKPYSVKELLTKIDEVLESTKLRNEIIYKNDILEEEIKKNKEKHKIMLSQARFASMGELLNMIAHQWRQPLSSIATAVYTLQAQIEILVEDDKIFNKELFHKSFYPKLNDIQGYIRVLNNTIEDFRNFYKTSKKKELVAIDELINAALHLINPAFENESIVVFQDIKTNTKIKVIRNEIIHVILNLLKNARDVFLDLDSKDKKIFIEAYDEDSKLFLKIRDNAGGIPADIINYIFEPYFSSKEEKNGTGLGLYLAKMIVEKHHKGSIIAQNENGGAELIITLPINIQ